MTASYTMPLHRKFKVRVRSHKIDPSKITVVVPVYNDWEGLRLTLDSLNNMVHKPLRIHVVNDNKTDDIPEWLNDYCDVEVVGYSGNRGPAFARNAGFGLIQYPDVFINTQTLDSILREGRKVDHDPRLRELNAETSEFTFTAESQWYYFTDCGCTHDPNLFMHFSMAREREGDSLVAVCGSTEGVGDGLVNQYMTHQGILNPPLENLMHGKKVAQSVVTCNVLVYGLAFSYLKGFDTKFPEAAAEDLDFGFRLREIGLIGFEEKAVVRHKFDECMDDFMKRFERYGRGTRLLELKHNLSSLRPVHIEADQPHLQEFADLQCRHMQIGYDSIPNDQIGILEEPIHYRGSNFRQQVQGLGEGYFSMQPKEPGPGGRCII